MPLTKKDVNQHLSMLSDDCSLEDIMSCLEKIQSIEKNMFEKEKNEIVIPQEVLNNLKHELKN